MATTTETTSATTATPLPIDWLGAEQGLSVDIGGAPGDYKHRLNARVPAIQKMYEALPTDEQAILGQALRYPNSEPTGLTSLSTEGRSANYVVVLDCLKAFSDLDLGVPNTSPPPPPPPDLPQQNIPAHVVAPTDPMAPFRNTSPQQPQQPQQPQVAPTTFNANIPVTNQNDLEMQQVFNALYNPFGVPGAPKPTSPYTSALPGAVLPNALYTGLLPNGTQPPMGYVPPNLSPFAANTASGAPKPTSPYSSALPGAVLPNALYTGLLPDGTRPPMGYVPPNLSPFATNTASGGWW